MESVHSPTEIKLPEIFVEPKKSIGKRIFNVFLFGLKTTVIAGGIAGGAALMAIGNPIALAVGGICIFSSVIFAAVELKISARNTTKKHYSLLESNMQKQAALIEDHRNIIKEAAINVNEIREESKHLHSIIQEAADQIECIKDESQNLNCAVQDLKIENLSLRSSLDGVEKCAQDIRQLNNDHRLQINRSSQEIEIQTNGIKAVAESLSRFSQDFISIFFKFKATIDSIGNPVEVEMEGVRAAEKECIAEAEAIPIDSSAPKENKKEVTRNPKRDAADFLRMKLFNTN